MEHITVIGAGTMGNGIAHVFAQNGYHVNLVDVSSEALERGIETISNNLSRMISKEVISEKEKASTLKAINQRPQWKKGLQKQIW